MWTSALFLFALIGGLKFVYTYDRTRYRAQLQEWERILFEAAKYGGLVFVLLRAGVVPLLELCPRKTYSGLVAVSIYGSWSTWPALLQDIIASLVVWGRAWSHRWVPIPYLITFGICYWLAKTSAQVGNRWIDSTEAEEIQRAVDEHGDELLQLIQRAYVRGLAVLVTTRSRKVYVGLVLHSASLTKERYLFILPSLSGYREADSLEPRFTTNYVPAWDRINKLLDAIERLKKRQTEPGVRASQLEKRAKYLERLVGERLGVWIPCSEIISISPFDKRVAELTTSSGAEAGEQRVPHDH